MEMAALFLAAFGAEVVGTVAGFGSSTIFLPLAVMFVDFRAALTLVAVFHVFGNLGRVGFFRRGWDWNMIAKFGLPSVVFTVLGAGAVEFVPQELLMGILGVFLVFYGWSTFGGDGLRVKPTGVAWVVGGGISGFFAGLIGTGGALRGAFLTGFNLSKEKYVATAAFVALMVDMTRIPVYLAQGYWEERFYGYVPILLVLALAGSYVGKKIVAKIPQRKFRKVVAGAIILVGLKFIYDGFYF
ncbi:sulfonate transporter [Candidatus Amesbacteria bacterium RIFCSPHIGHO2_01_FULL_48_32]|uniref:Probable membrane transporter protein n=1 Tax=Candidatus Amesbacteria bacterium RIFCSPLOWO2_01_FULL_48_25 TaxID=1797259 RepID=A0A1F4ZDZ6_9BACT|nr:MAG: sulfonate transporter [Candidatus Amesbacteria bacterium RIFCSPHIGHO2_01_FULL_48_32]OGD04448.1 MAG: sulfonate transporter [Candidatus Amesbacteria bacterium RIFCSPLOWO2_01_FULL_48_25]